MATQPPLEEQVAAAQATTQISIDGAHRIVQVTMRKPLDIMPTIVNLPFSTIKALAGQIILGEAQNEIREHEEAQKNGVLQLQH